jgi:hypothetical protein
MPVLATDARRKLSPVNGYIHACPPIPAMLVSRILEALRRHVTRRVRPILPTRELFLITIPSHAPALKTLRRRLFSTIFLTKNFEFPDHSLFDPCSVSSPRTSVFVAAHSPIGTYLRMMNAEKAKFPVFFPASTETTCLSIHQKHRVKAQGAAAWIAAGRTNAPWRAVVVAFRYGTTAAA